jgi:hypothetical protein
MSEALQTSSLRLRRSVHIITHTHAPKASTKYQASFRARLLTSYLQFQGQDEPKSLEKQRLDKDATAPAKAHGNEPSKGAKIDQELREEEEAELAKKGKK